MTVPESEKGYQANVPTWYGLFWAEDEDPDLVFPRSVGVYDRMLKEDAQAVSVLRAVSLPILRTGWRLDPSGARPAVVNMVADDLGLLVLGKKPKRRLRTKNRFSWQQHLTEALEMLTYGFAVFEQVAPAENGQNRLRKLAYRPPQTIKGIDVADDGGLVAVRQNPRVGKLVSTDVKLEVTRLVVYTNERKGANWYGRSLLRSAHRPYRLKDRALRTQAQTLDRNGLGIPIYEAAGIPDEQLAVMEAADRQAAVQNELKAGLDMASKARSGDNSGAATPKGAKLRFRGVEGSLPDADKQIRYHDEQIARAVLAHFLNLGTETGSWALGSTFADFFTLSLQTVAMQIADTANQHVVEDLVDWNFGESEPAPRIVFDEIGSKHPATAEAIKALVDAGVITADDDLEQYLRTALGLPDPDPDTARQPTPGGTPTPASPSAPQPPAEPQQPRRQQP